MRKCLVLAATVLLTLPPGWCCIVASLPPAPATLPVAQECCPPPADKGKAPARPPLKVCCCDNHISLKPTPDDLDFAAVTWPCLDIPSAAVCHPALQLAPVAPPPRALNVLLCVWLC